MDDTLKTSMENASKQIYIALLVCACCGCFLAGRISAPQGGAKKKKQTAPMKSLLRMPAPIMLQTEAYAAFEDIDDTNPKLVKKYGKEKVKWLHSMVDSDWHDGFDEQAHEVIEYFEGVAFERCHEVMRALADSWENMKSIPSRYGVPEVFEEDCGIDFPTIEADGLEEPIKFESPGDFFCQFWPVILWAAASKEEIGDELLYRWMKDAHEYGAALPDSAGTSALVRGVDEVKDASGAVVREATPALRTNKEGADLKKGHKRIQELFANSSEWEDLPSRKASHKMKRVLDRRYSGAMHLRTRDFSDDGLLF